MANIQGLTYEVANVDAIPRITKIRGQEVPTGAISSSVVSQTDVRSMSDLSVKTVVAAFQWARRNR